MPGDAPRVLYLVISGAPAPEGLPSLVTLLQEAGWRVVVFSTPVGTRFADLDELERLTGGPVRWEYRMPGTGTRTPPADVVLACPLSVNSVNKFAHGHADNFAVGLLCEMVGYGVPVVVPHCSRNWRRTRVRREPGHAAGHGECAPVAEGRSAIVPLQALMEMAPLAFGWDPRTGIGAPSDVPAVDLAVAQLDGRRGPGYANRLQHADDLGPPSHNLTVRLHPVQVRMQQRLERAPITLDDRGMRAWCDVLHLGIVSHTDR